MLRIRTAVIMPLIVAAGAASALYLADGTREYGRGEFGTWAPAGDGCTVREKVMIRDAVKAPKRRADCRLVGGAWVDPYTGRRVQGAGNVSVDHLVAVKEAWRSGAHAWDEAERRDFFNDTVNLRTVARRVNAVKGDKDPAHWLPKRGLCAYVDAFTGVKAAWGLTADEAERRAVQAVRGRCGA